MAIDIDTLVNHRRQKRHTSIWRFAAVALGLVALFVIAESAGLMPSGSQVARVTVDGIITDDVAVLEMLDEIAEDDRVKAVILRIDSPGGTTAGSEALYVAVRDVAAKKPVVAVLGTVAASGGYVAALSADHVVTRGNTITGSIGVIFQWAQVSELLDKLGVEMRDVKLGPLKQEPNAFAPPSDEALQSTQALVESSYEWFVGLVAERRNFTNAEARAVADGRIYTGWQALTVGLADEIGGEKEARDWLAREHKLDKDLPVVDWQPDYDDPGTGTFVARIIAPLVAALLGETEKTLSFKRLTLDGLLSVWHPES